MGAKWFLSLWFICHTSPKPTVTKQTESNTVSKWTEVRFHMTRHQVVLSGASKLIFEHMVCSMQNVHLCCIKINTISKLTKPNCPKQTEARFHMTHIIKGVLSGASKLISEHMVCSMQTVHLSNIKISTISKLTKPSFHLCLFT